jgi:hypothetical protein
MASVNERQDRVAADVSRKPVTRTLSCLVILFSHTHAAVGQLRFINVFRSVAYFLQCFLPNEMIDIKRRHFPLICNLLGFSCG